MIRSLQQWWVDHANGGIPDRADFEPPAFRSTLPYLLISDVEHTPFRIRYRLVGTRVVAATGYDITGHYLDELDTTNEEEPWLEDYALCYRTRRPIMGTTSVLTRTGLRFSYEFGIFPVTKGGSNLEQFIAVEDYFEFARLFRELPEWGRSVGLRLVGQ